MVTTTLVCEVSPHNTQSRRIGVQDRIQTGLPKADGPACQKRLLSPPPPKSRSWRGVCLGFVFLKLLLGTVKKLCHFFPTEGPRTGSIVLSYIACVTNCKDGFKATGFTSRTSGKAKKRSSDFITNGFQIVTERWNSKCSSRKNKSRCQALKDENTHHEPEKGVQRGSDPIKPVPFFGDSRICWSVNLVFQTSALCIRTLGVWSWLEKISFPPPTKTHFPKHWRIRG